MRSVKATRNAVRWLIGIVAVGVIAFVLVSKRPPFTPVPFLKNCPVTYRQVVLGDPSKISPGSIIATWQEGEREGDVDLGAYFTSRYHGDAAVQIVQYIFRGTAKDLKTQIDSFAPGANSWTYGIDQAGVIFRDKPGQTKLMLNWKRRGNDSFNVTVTEYRPINLSDRIEAFLHNGYHNASGQPFPGGKTNLQDQFVIRLNPN